MIEFKTINELKHILFASYTKNTAYKKDQKNWNLFNRYAGQCAISSMIAYNIWGGKILYGYAENLGVYHYWNYIDNAEIDFTIEQFKERPTFTKIREKTFQELYEQESVRIRYEELLTNVTALKKKIDSLEKDIYNCNLCKNVDKFISKTIYYGSNCNLLFIGEAPAKNGWHVTGKVWTSPDGKIIPSGKVFEKLLKIINLDLFDVSFTEAIKCYPNNGKVTAKNCENCQNYLFRIINLLKPNCVIPMGAHATRLLLSNNLPLSKVTGQFYMNANLDEDIYILPMYHPSPISPVGYKGNIEIFEMLNERICENKGRFDAYCKKV